MAAFNDAMSNGMSPTDAFGNAVAERLQLWFRHLIWVLCKHAA